MLKRYQTVSELPAEMPLFPLAGAILLPRATLPLNIFEPRYLRMFDDAIGGARIVGMIQPAGAGGPTGSPLEHSAELRDVGCAGRITAYQERDDGRLSIVLTGLARFRIQEERPLSRPYRVMTVDYLRYAHDLASAEEDESVDRSRLLDTLKRYLAQRNLKADWAAIQQTGTETLVNWLSVASPFGSAEKQALLEAVTLKERAEALITLAEMELATGGGGQGSSEGRLQ